MKTACSVLLRKEKMYFKTEKAGYQVYFLLCPTPVFMVQMEQKCPILFRELKILNLCFRRFSGYFLGSSIDVNSLAANS